MSNPLVINGCDIFKIDSGSSLNYALFVKTIYGVGYVDIICSSRDGVVTYISNCVVVNFQKMLEHNNLINPVSTFWGSFFCPSSPFSCYKVSKNKSEIIDDFVKKNDSDLIASWYINLGNELKLKDKLVINADDNPASVLSYKTMHVNSRMVKWKKQYLSKRVGQMTEKLLVIMKNRASINIDLNPFINSCHFKNNKAKQL